MPLTILIPRKILRTLRVTVTVTVTAHRWAHRYRSSATIISQPINKSSLRHNRFINTMADNDNTRALLKSNAKWAEGVSEVDPDFFPDSAKNPQKPHTLWIGCADSRVPESVITDSKPGVIFVHRNIANQFPADDTNVLSVLAFAVNYLGVENVIIVGHSHCGGAAASLKAAQSPNFLPESPIITVGGEPADSPLNRWLEPLTLLAHSLQLPDHGEESIETVVRENVKAQVENLANTETIRKAWTEGTPKKQKVSIHGWVYDLGSGLLKDLGISRGPPE